MDCNLCPWNSPGQNTGVVCHSLLQKIFPNQGSNPALPHFRQILQALWLSKEALWLSKQSDSFLMGHRWGCNNGYESFIARDLRENLVSGWLEDYPHVAAFEICKYIQLCGTTILSPAVLQTRWYEGVPWMTVMKLRALNKCINYFLVGTS